MSRLFYHVMQDNVGNLLFDVSGTMRLAGTGTVATIYGDEALTVILPNPMTNHPSFGSFKCFLGAGDYDFYMAKAGYTFETLTGVQGHGTMAQQDAASVAITGGAATLTQLTAQLVFVPDHPGDNAIAFYTTLNAAGGTGRYALNCGGTAPGYLGGTLGVQALPVSNAGLKVGHDKNAQHGILFQPTGVDVGPGAALQFQNLAATPVGTITTTATATAYNTSSDARLKHAIVALTGALDVVRGLRPVTFRWNADDSADEGFIAHELMNVIPRAVTGEPDAVNEDGTIKPQQVDHSKLVVWLCGAVQELAAQVGILQAHVSALQAQLEP